MSNVTKATVYGNDFTLNVAVKSGLDWTGKNPRYVHYCLIQLGDDEKQAREKATTIKAAFIAGSGNNFKFTLHAKPKVAYSSEEI